MALDTATVRIAAKVAGEEAVRSLAKSLEITEKEAKQLIQTNLKLGGSAKSAAAGMTAAGAASSTAAKGFSAAGAAVGFLASTLAPLAALVGAGAIGRLGMDAETAEAKLRTMSRAIKDFDQLPPLIQQVSRETGGMVGPAELANAAYEVLSAGATDAADAAAKLKAALILAKGGSVETAIAVDGLTSVMNSYMVETSRSTEVTDKIRQTVDDGKITFEEYARDIGRAAAVAAASGVSLDELNAAIATVTSGGVQAESAIRGMRQLIVNLVKPTQEASAYAAALGVKLGATELSTKGLTAKLEELRKATGGNVGNLSKLITDVDSLTVAQSLFVGGGEKFKQLLDRQANSAGSAARAADTMAQTTQTAVNRMGAAWESLAKRIVEVMRPTFTWLADRLASLFGAVDSAIGAIGNLVRSVQQLPVVGGLLNGSNFATGAQTALSLTPGANVFANIFGVFSPNRSAQPAGQGRRNMGTYVVNGVTYDAATGRPVSQGGGSYRPLTTPRTPSTVPDLPDVTPEKPRTAEEIQASIRGLNVDAQVQQLQRLRLLADEYAKAQIDFTLAKDRAEQKFLELSGKKGVTRPEVDAARKLRDAEITTAETVKKQAIAKVREDVAKVKTEADAALTTLREAIDPKALLERTKDDFVAAVDAQVEVLTEAVKTAVAQLKEARRRLLELGGPQAKNLIAQIDAKITANEKSLADPSGIRGIATDQVRARISQTLGADQQRELQQLQDQFQALLTPYGELTAQQQLENRLKREGIALSPEDRAQRFQEAAAIDRTKEAIRQLNEQQQLSRQLAEDIADGFREMFKGLLFQAQSLEEALSNLFGRLADQLFNLAFNIGVFGNPFGFAGSVFGQVLPGFEKRAAGGPVSAGSPYIVGERGPEVFVPRTSGTIVPNGAGGVSVVVNVDAKGTSVQGNDPQGQQLGRVVSAAVQAEIMRQQRPGGLLAGGRR